MKSDQFEKAVPSTRGKLTGALPDAVDAAIRNLTCGHPEHEVAAARLVMELGGAAPSAAQATYEFIGHMTNSTKYPLRLIAAKTNGRWGDGPPPTIEPGGTANFSASYEGLDFEGGVIYATDGNLTQMWIAGWDIPVIGYNEISDATTIPNTAVRYEGGGGWHSEVHYYLEPA